MRLLVAITFHYRPAKLEVLLAVVRAYLSFAVESVDVVVVTNTSAAAEIERIDAILQPLVQNALLPRVIVAVESHPGLADPWHLPWCHKHLIRDRFLRDPVYTHFIYGEDDLLVSWVNFSYWLKHRELLDAHGLIPSFQQIEYNADDGHLYLVAQATPDAWDALVKIDAGDLQFVTSSYPYCACYVLDRRLAQAYAESRSFGQQSSLEVAPHWGMAERAAMGLCFEDVPPDQYSRHAVPVIRDRLATSPACWLFHLPNNYATRTNTTFGKIRPECMFRRGYARARLICSAQLPSPAAQGGHVDELRMDGRILYLAGWGMWQDDGENAVIVHSNLAIETSRLVRSSRPDVVAATSDDRLAWSGFQIYLVVKDSRASEPIWLQLATRDSVFGERVLSMQIVERSLASLQRRGTLSAD